MTLKAGKDVVELLALAYRSNQPVLLEGSHGIGKSEIIQQAARRLKIDCIVRDLSTMEPPDLIGLPTQKAGKTVYLPPGFLPDGGKGFLALEELNRSEKYMMSPCLQLLTARCLNDYKLPPGWLPVAAINPAGEAYDVHELDPALVSRFIRVQIEADVTTWLEWAARNGVHQSVRRFVNTVDDVFKSSNPRAWAYVSNLLVAHEASGVGDRRILMAAVAGVVGEIHATAFLKMYRTGDVAIAVDSVLRKYRSVKSTVIGWAQARKTDLLQGIAHKVQVELQNSDLCVEIRESDIMTRNLKDFISDLPADIGRKVHSAARNGGALS